MTKDDDFKDKLQATVTKSEQGEIYERTTLNESVLQPEKVTNSTSFRRQNREDVSDASSVLKEQEGGLAKYAKVLSKSHLMRITEENKTKRTVPFGKKTSDTLRKEEIATSILDEIFTKIENLHILSTESSHYYHPLSKNLKPEINDMRSMAELSMKTSSYSSRQHRDQACGKKRERRQLASIVDELDLPISLSTNKPLVESRLRIEQLIVDTHVTTSSKIVEPPDKLSKSDRSQSSQSGDGISSGTTEETPKITSPFELSWCFGFNAEVPVINLSTNHVSQILFANSQYAVIYDFHEDTMSFLQGHLNTVSCLATDQTGHFLVTADSGSDAGNSRVIVWDRSPCLVQVLDNVHPLGCAQVGLSSNGDFLITVSAKEIPASIKVWEWQKNTEHPSFSTTVKESLGHVKKLTPRPNSKSEFAVTFERSVIFARVVWHTVFQELSEKGKVTEKIKDCETGVSALTPQKLGSLTDTTFLDDSEVIALSSTCKGYVVVWDNNISSKHKKTYSKYVRLHLDCITNIQSVDSKIAVATVSGNVSFYDSDLKILFFHKVHQEPLVSLSFNLTSHYHHDTKCGEHPSCANTWRKESHKLADASLQSDPFSIRHFVTSTESGRIAYVNASCGVPKYLPFPRAEMFTALDVLPNSKFLCAGTASGKCILFDTDDRKVKVTQQIKVPAHLCQAISFLAYSPSGYTLACSMYTGDIWILDPLLLTPILDSPLTDCDCCITQMVFSPSTEYLIVCDVSFCISAYFLGERPILIGQYIAHYESILNVVIRTTEPGDRELYVFTLSADRSICKFVIDKDKNSFEFLFNQRVEQTAVPMYSIFFPFPSTGTYLGMNSHCKWRILDKSITPNDHVSKRYRGTFQAPDFGSLINYFDAFENNHKPYLFFKTKHHIGIQLLPIDGNPFQALGFRASPTNITCCRIHPNGKYVFTISESFSGISMWEINTRAVEDYYKSGGEGLEPFLRMLGGEKEQEIRDMFDLGQFLHQGESPSLVRTLKNSLPICEVANVLQALGCLMSKQEIAEVTNEVMTWYQESPSYSIEYVDFVRLYLNVRKPYDLKIKELRKAFRDFHAGFYSEPGTDLEMADYNPVFDSASFVQKLLETGEEINPQELYADLSILTGGQPEPPDDGSLPAQVPPTMPKEISFETFVKDVLGFAVDDSVLEEN